MFAREGSVVEIDDGLEAGALSANEGGASDSALPQAMLGVSLNVYSRVVLLALRIVSIGSHRCDDG